MKKLIVLALLGLVLGAGAWKVQNPQGTLSDARQQVVALGERLNSGVQAIRLPEQGDGQSPQQTLEERLTLLEESIVSNSRDEIPSAVDELTEVAQDAEAGNAANVVRLDAIDSRLELLVRRLDEQTVEQGLQQVRQGMETVSQDVAALRESASSRDAEVRSELATITEQIEALGLRLDTLAASSGTVSADALQGDDSGAEANSGSASLAASIDQRFTALESRLSTVNSDSRQIASLNDELQSAREQIRQLQESTASNRRNVDRIDGSVAQLRTTGESMSIDAVQAEIGDQLTLVQSQLESSDDDANIIALQRLLDNARVRINEVEARVQRLPASSEEAGGAQDAQSTLESRVVSLNERLADLRRRNPDTAGAEQEEEPVAAGDFVSSDDLRGETEPQAVQYKIYFDRNSVEITDDAAVVLDSFIAQEKNRTTGVSIFGFTDTLGSATYNQQLALQRATNVRSYLIQNGFDYTKIKALNGLGEDAAAAVLPDNAGDAQQRVVVLYATQP